MTTNESNYIDENKNPIETEDFAKALAAEEENSCKRKKEVIDKKLSKKCSKLERS